MRLHWFSPLPPARTAIADYTMRILPMLGKQAEIILWTDQAEWDSGLENYGEVRRYQPQHMPWAELNRGHMSIHHIGNNRLFHSSIWQVSRCHPGIVVLHDRCLQNFFAGLYREQWQDRDGYVAQMERYYGQLGRRHAEMFWHGHRTIEDMVESYPLTPLAVGNALGVLVHTEEGLDDLKEKTLCPVMHAPLPYLASPRRHESTSAAAKARAGGPPYRLIVFGYIELNRRLDALLQALAGFPERDQFRLEIYGQLWDDNYVRGQIRSLGIRELVTLHGFVSEAELDEALAKAHLGINLRYPTMGEASLSQLRMWDHALPTLVTRVDWYAKFPESAVAFVRPNHEIEDIQAHLRAFLDAPEQFALMGQRGRCILEEQHTPQVYVRALMNLVAEAQRFRPCSVVYKLAQRVGTEMRMWTNQPAPQLASYLWEQGEMVHQKSALQKRTGGEAPPQFTLFQAIRDAIADQAKRLHDEQTSTLEILQQVLAAHAEHLDQLPTAILQDALKKPYNRELALQSPLRIGSHDIGFRYLFDFAVVAKGLDLRPGAEVLDFAAGPTWVSELLNRLGYITVAFDVDHEILAMGRERFFLDSRCDRDRTRFVAGDGLCLPFRDESFDGLICMNALHHMPDYRTTLAEMYRVLRPGGRAVFSEPGSEHSKNPESINAIKQYGVLERDVILSEIHQLAQEVGFRRMVLKPFVYPEHVELNYEDLHEYRNGGKVSNPFLSYQEIVDFMETHPLFYLEKDGMRPLTSASAPPGFLRAKLVVKGCPRRVRRGDVVRVVARCENTGQSLWLSKPRPLGGYVTFGVKLLTTAGQLLNDTKGRRPLSEDVPPGGSTEVVSEVSLEGIEAGRYRILFDLVNEQVSWFQDIGSEVVEQWLEVV